MMKRPVIAPMPISPAPAAAVPAVRPRWSVIGTKWTASVADIIDLFAERYAAPRDTIAADILEMLQELAASGFLVERGGAR